MAYTKIKPIKSGTHIENSLGYIQNSSKTENNFFVFSYMCSAENAFSEFEIIRENAIKKGNNIAHHIYQSFSPNDNISPKQALEIGKELMEKLYPNHQYVIAVHTDKKHIHSHIIVNSVDFVNYKKINSNKESLGKMRKISDEICKENGLSIIKPIPINHRKNLRKTIDLVLKNSDNFENFLENMQKENYEIKLNKNLAFKGKDDERFMRADLLGTAYTLVAIKKRFESSTDIKNTKKSVYSDKSIRMSNRKRLKYAIDNAVKKSKTFDEFLECMRNENYEIKQGKNLAFRNISNERFIRLNSLGDDYSEEMLRLKIEDFEEYKIIKEEIENNKIDKITDTQSKYYSKWDAAENINKKIKTLNFLKENNINSLDDLNNKISEIEKINLAESREISDVKKQISKHFDIINSGRIYWQYKPIAEQARRISDPQKRNEYMAEHKQEMEKFKAAVEIMNSSKGENGKLPKSEILYKEIEKLNEEKEQLIKKNNKTKAEIQKLRNAKYNIFDSFATEDEEEKEKRQSQNKRQSL